MKCKLRRIRHLTGQDFSVGDSLIGKIGDDSAGVKIAVLIDVGNCAHFRPPVVNCIGRIAELQSQITSWKRQPTLMLFDVNKEFAPAMARFLRVDDNCFEQVLHSLRMADPVNECNGDVTPAIAPDAGFTMQTCDLERSPVPCYGSSLCAHVRREKAASSC
jgi:hypothetical protein